LGITQAVAIINTSDGTQPHLTTNFAQANLNQILAKLYSDLHQPDLLEKHAQIAFKLLPNGISITKLYAMVLISRGQPDRARVVLSRA